VLPAIIKLLARTWRFWTGKGTKFYYISRDSKHFLSDLEALFDLLRTGRLCVPIKAVIPLRDIRRAHHEWSQGAGIGSTLIQVATKGKQMGRTGAPARRIRARKRHGRYFAWLICAYCDSLGKPNGLNLPQLQARGH
jgi:NADPH:quinone reductase-like Zn-dependent oxidoreductase